MASLKNKTPPPRQTAKRGRNKDGCEHGRGVVGVTIVVEPVVVPVPRTVVVEVEVKHVTIAVRAAQYCIACLHGHHCPSSTLRAVSHSVS